ncbi:MAG: beta-ketoacyl-[acyl-carrier-protein] synthase family protein, partial [Planctomycetota bacterium]
SLLAISSRRLPRTLNYESIDPGCPLAVTTSDDVPAGQSFLRHDVTPQGQAAALLIAADV